MKILLKRPMGSAILIVPLVLGGMRFAPSSFAETGMDRPKEIASVIQSQEKVIIGKVLDSETGEGMPGA